jgi:hypothetical protein
VQVRRAYLTPCLTLEASPASRRHLPPEDTRTSVHLERPDGTADSRWALQAMPTVGPHVWQLELRAGGGLHHVNQVNAAAVEQILHVSAPTVCSRWTSTAERERLVSLSLMVVHAAGVVPAVGCCPRSSGACGSTCAALQKDASKFLWTVLGTSVSFWDRSKALSARTVVVTRSLLSVNTARERAARRWVVPSKSVLGKQARPLRRLVWFNVVITPHTV